MADMRKIEEMGERFIEAWKAAEVGGEAALDAVLKRQIEEALADPAPSIRNEQVFADLKAHYEKRRG